MAANPEFYYPEAVPGTQHEYERYRVTHRVDGGAEIVDISHESRRNAEGEWRQLDSVSVPKSVYTAMTREACRPVTVSVVKTRSNVSADGHVTYTGGGVMETTFKRMGTISR